MIDASLLWFVLGITLSPSIGKSADPTTIAVTGGALVLAYFLLPPVFSAISFNFRDLTPAQVLDLVSSQNYTLIDIRSEEDKDNSVLEEVPSKLKSLDISCTSSTQKASHSSFRRCIKFLPDNGCLLGGVSTS
ncbi:hypothetical protein L2E82_48223 [Cichorium intybus]|uniref:Uncharacterized protein n=1 Tax=Cichorium intybus TaxID=13427 RepID=A0ACB8YXX1_CICIN|nr:hypothetical protein L2E82_48223 [Cichorium intybus]